MESYSYLSWTPPGRRRIGYSSGGPQRRHRVPPSRSSSSSRSRQPSVSRSEEWRRACARDSRHLSATAATARPPAPPAAALAARPRRMLGRLPVSLRLSRGLLRGSSRCRGLSAMAGGDGEGQLGDFFEYMERLRNYERSGVPRGAGTDSDDGFDLGRMRRLLRRLGDPHTHFPVSRPPCPLIALTNAKTLRLQRMTSSKILQ